MYLPVDETLLARIVEVCCELPYPVVFRALYLLCFFSFLRLSNILPHSLTSFDSSRLLCRAEITFSDKDAVIIVKWSKTLQDRRHIATINIPCLNSSLLCPVTALQVMLDNTVSNKNDPLFMYNKLGKWLILTDSVARKHLKDVSRALGLVKPLTFHDFRRGGATWAYNHSGYSTARYMVISVRLEIHSCSPCYYFGSFALVLSPPCFLATPIGAWGYGFSQYFTVYGVVL